MATKTNKTTSPTKKTSKSTKPPTAKAPKTKTAKAAKPAAAKAVEPAPAKLEKPDAATPETAKAPAKAKREPKQRPAKKTSGLDLAAKVLAEANEPLSAKTIAERVIAAGWKTDGATPHATLYAAMGREISKKGKDARFKKVDRGLFTAAATNGKGA